MKHLFALLFLLSLACPINAQHLEYAFMAGGGLFHYNTKKATEPYFSTINLSSLSSTGNYANNPYGNKNGQTFQLSFQLKKVTRRKLLWGALIEYESVESKKKINWVFGPSSYNFREATGNYSMKNKLLVISPYIGYRFQISKSYLDITGGIDITDGISAVHEQGSATIITTDDIIEVNKDSKAKNYGFFETRARFQGDFGYKKWGLYFGYSCGFYEGKLATFGGTPLYSFSRYFRGGIFYRLK